MSPAPDAPVRPVPHSRLPEGSGSDASTSKKSSSPTKVQDDLKVSDSSDPKLETQKRKSTIKYQVSASSQSPPLGSRYALRPLGHRKESTTSVQSRYSEMTMDYFESIPAKYNTYAGFFTWILLAGFVLGPSAQQAATQAGLGETYRRVVRKVPLLALSIVCSGIGMSGIFFLWFRWRKNYMWLIHKVFLPGALNGLAGTLAVSVNIWAIQGGKFTFNSTTIITLSITLGATVTCLLLTFVYQFALISIKKEHRRLVRQTKSDEGLEEAPTVKKTIADHDFSDTQDSIWNVLTG
ncbi:unnamed protein product [Rhizoctonia solani]|uniref:Uncharacterized protein n=1 Tax=Rhizoctonia solani TaxID=456999 RepID=A0A8H3CMQ1_9AGAM|nr:unnamed protein product [Rhizoctonia solani]